MNNLIKGYTDIYTNRNIKNLYPDEYIVRIFYGIYPKLDLKRYGFRGKKICEVGCGDGRNLQMLSRLGFDISATEIGNDIVQHVMYELKKIKIHSNIKKGSNKNIPFNNQEFEFLLSWNSCYYMEESEEIYLFKKHVIEFHRVLKPEGILILSIPMKSNYIFNNGIITNGYIEITSDPYKIRNGQIFKYFLDEQDIINCFSPYFKDFNFSTRRDYCFGIQNDSYVVVCKKNN